MLKESKCLVRKTQLDVVHSHNDVGRQQVWPGRQRFCEVTHRQVVLRKAVISEAEIDLRLNQSWIEREHAPEFFCSTGELALLHGLLAGAKVLGDLVFRRLGMCELGSQGESAQED